MEKDKSRFFKWASFKWLSSSTMLIDTFFFYDAQIVRQEMTSTAEDETYTLRSETKQNIRCASNYSYVNSAHTFIKHLLCTVNTVHIQCTCQQLLSSTVDYIFSITLLYDPMPWVPQKSMVGPRWGASSMKFSMLTRLTWLQRVSEAFRNTVVLPGHNTSIKCLVCCVHVTFISHKPTAHELSTV